MSRSATIYGPAAIQGEVSIPGDKSISHRVAMLASLAEGSSTIEGYSTGADCHTTLSCIRSLGIEVEESIEHIVIHGKGLNGYSVDGETVYLDAGNSGSTIRMISGILAGQPFISVLDGDASLRRRPMRRVISPLEMMGARIESRDNGLPPLTIHGTKLHPIHYESPVASAQVKSCVMLAGLFAEGVTSVGEPEVSRNHSELMFPVFGARIRAEGRTISVEGPARLVPVTYRVPGDMSSAAFFASAAAMTPGSRLVIKSVNLNPTRTGVLEVLESLGAGIEHLNVREENGEIVGDLLVTGRGLKADAGRCVIAGELIPKVIDELPMLAVLATQVEGRVEVRDARELRIKESDRIKSIANGIRAFGGAIEEFDDGFAVSGPQNLTGTKVCAEGDHRIAMALSIAGLTADGMTEVSDADCVAISFPEFFDILNSVRIESSFV